MTPPAPSAGRVLRDSLKAAAGWILRVLLWVTAVVVAASLGGPLAVLGFSGIALALAGGLVLLGATTWRRAGLPLSLTAAALALTAAIVAAQPVRIDRSHGLLIATPKRPSDLQPEYRRGAGNVVLDLRDFGATPGSRTTLKARSDTGRVVVALPQGRCFNLEVELARGRGGDSVLFEAPLAFARTVAGYSTGVATLHGQQGLWDPYPAESARPESPTRLIAFGRTVFLPGFRGDAQPVSWRRQAARPGAATLLIRADVATDLIIRDYPDAAGPAFSVYEASTSQGRGFGGDSVSYLDPTQVSDVSWPEMVQVPPSPGDRRWRDRFQRRQVTRARAARQARLWGPWFERARVAAQRRSVLGAGSCSTRAEQATYWTRFSFTRFSGKDAELREPYAVAVNGRGQTRLYRESYTSDEPEYVTLKPRDNPFTNAAIFEEFAS